MDSKSIPFGLRTIEITCNKIVKEYAPEGEEEDYYGSRGGRGGRGGAQGGRGGHGEGGYREK